VCVEGRVDLPLELNVCMRTRAYSGFSCCNPYSYIRCIQHSDAEKPVFQEHKQRNISLNFGQLSSVTQAYFSQFEQETQIYYTAKGTNGDIGGIMSEGVHEMDVGTIVKIIGGFDHSVKPHYIELLE
jgi:hypothetical protein